MSAFKQPKQQGLSREERQMMEDERERKKFPKAAKWFLFFCWGWVTTWSSLISSGMWASTMRLCTVEITWWEGFVTQSVIILGIIGFFILIIQSIWHERNV